MKIQAGFNGLGAIVCGGLAVATSETGIGAVICGAAAGAGVTAAASLKTEADKEDKITQQYKLDLKM